MGFDHIHTQLLPLPPLRPTSHHLQLLLSLWNQGCALACGYLPRVMSLKKTDLTPAESIHLSQVAH